MEDTIQNYGPQSPADLRWSQGAKNPRSQQTSLHTWHSGMLFSDTTCQDMDIDSDYEDSNLQPQQIDYQLTNRNNLNNRFLSLVTPFHLLQQLTEETPIYHRLMSNPLIVTFLDYRTPNIFLSPYKSRLVVNKITKLILIADVVKPKIENFYYEYRNLFVTCFDVTTLLWLKSKKNHFSNLWPGADIHILSKDDFDVPKEGSIFIPNPSKAVARSVKRILKFQNPCLLVTPVQFRRVYPGSRIPDLCCFFTVNCHLLELLRDLDMRPYFGLSRAKVMLNEQPRLPLPELPKSQTLPNFKAKKTQAKNKLPKPFQQNPIDSDHNSQSLPSQTSPTSESQVSQSLHSQASQLLNSKPSEPLNSKTSEPLKAKPSEPLKSKPSEPLKYKPSEPLKSQVEQAVNCQTAQHVNCHAKQTVNCQAAEPVICQASPSLSLQTSHPAPPALTEGSSQKTELNSAQTSQQSQLLDPQFIQPQALVLPPQLAEISQLFDYLQSINVLTPEAAHYYRSLLYYQPSNISGLTQNYVHGNISQDSFQHYGYSNVPFSNQYFHNNVLQSFPNSHNQNMISNFCTFPQPTPVPLDDPKPPPPPPLPESPKDNHNSELLQINLPEGINKPIKVEVIETFEMEEPDPSTSTDAIEQKFSDSSEFKAAELFKSSQEETKISKSSGISDIKEPKGSNSFSITLPKHLYSTYVKEPVTPKPTGSVERKMPIDSVPSTSSNKSSIAEKLITSQHFKSTLISEIARNVDLSGYVESPKSVKDSSKKHSKSDIFKKKSGRHSKRRICKRKSERRERTLISCENSTSREKLPRSTPTEMSIENMCSPVSSLGEDEVKEEEDPFNPF